VLIFETYDLGHEVRSNLIDDKKKKREHLIKKYWGIKLKKKYNKNYQKIRDQIQYKK